MIKEIKTSRYEAAHLTPEQTPKDPGEGYELVKNLIFDQVYKFHARFGGEFDELVGQANLAFVKGHAQFTRGTRRNGTPLTHTYAVEIRRWVWYEMFDLMRQRIKRSKIAPMGAIEEGQEFPDLRPKFNVNYWAEGLGDDSRYVVSLVLNPPATVEQTAEAKGGEPRNYRSTVRAYLQYELGWAAGRVNNAFEEIRRALG